MNVASNILKKLSVVITLKLIYIKMNGNKVIYLYYFMSLPKYLWPLTTVLRWTIIDVWDFLLLFLNS